MRERLPDRRFGLTEIIPGPEGRDWVVTFNFDDQGRVREVFAKPPKPDSALESLLDDTMIVLSIALQHGVAITDLHDTLSGRGVERQAETGSVYSFIGQVTERAARLERDKGDMARAVIGFARDRIAAEAGVRGPGRLIMDPVP